MSTNVVQYRKYDREKLRILFVVTLVLYLHVDLAEVVNDFCDQWS